jgi:hypothetical protein
MHTVDGILLQDLYKPEIIKLHLTSRNKIKEILENKNIHGTLEGIAILHRECVPVTDTVF